MMRQTISNHGDLVSLHFPDVTCAYGYSGIPVGTLRGKADTISSRL